LSRKFRNRISKEVAVAVIIIVMVFLLFFSYPVGGLILNTTNPWMVVDGTSMEPSFHYGDLIVIGGVSPEELRLGDVIVFQKVNLIKSPNKLTTIPLPYAHRIVYVNQVGDQYSFVTKGDNNMETDVWSVPSNGVIGKVVLVVPKLGFLIVILDKIEVKIGVIAAIALIFFLWSSKKRTQPQSLQRKAMKTSLYSSQ